VKGRLAVGFRALVGERSRRQMGREERETESNGHENGGGKLKDDHLPNPTCFLRLRCIVAIWPSYLFDIVLPVMVRFH
jgi:hypothetical protein